MKTEQELMAIYIRVYNKLKMLLETNQSVAVVYNTPIRGIPGNKVRLGWFASGLSSIETSLGTKIDLYRKDYESDEHYIKDIIEKYMTLTCNDSIDNLKIVFELESRV